jgi:hypothetical protein
MANRFEPSKTRYQRQKLFYPVGKVWLRPTFEYPRGRVVEIRGNLGIMRVKEFSDMCYFCVDIEAEFDQTDRHRYVVTLEELNKNFIEVPFEYAKAAYNRDLRHGIGDPDGLRYFNEKLKQREWSEPIYIPS